MRPGFPHGLFFRDTRFLSELRLRVNGQWPEPLAATTVDPFSAAFVLRDQPRPGFADSALMVFRNRYVGRGMREDVTVRNYGLEPALCVLEMPVAADFADLFEVKEGRVEKVGRSERPRRRAAASRGSTGAGSSPAARTSTSPSRRSCRRPTRCYEVVVPPGGEWSTCLQLTPVVDERGRDAALSLRSPGRALDAGGATGGMAAQPAGDRRPTTKGSPRCSTAPPRTSPRSASSIPSSRPHRRRRGRARGS